MSADRGEVFRSDRGTLYVVRCPKCFLENYAAAVSTGQCAWCGYVAVQSDDPTYPVLDEPERLGREENKV